MIIPFDGYINNALALATKLRKGGVDVFVYTEEGKLGKKMKYADALSIPYTILIGEDEVNKEKYMLKNMKSGEQEELDADEIITCIKK